MNATAERRVETNPKSSGTTTITLDFPVVSDGTEVRALYLRRPKVRDHMLADKLGGTDAEKEVRYFANLCEVAPEMMENLDMSDYKKLRSAHDGFFDAK
mgnify:CR=1 FL=1